MAIDGGRGCIVAPYVEDVEEVRAMVGAVHYRPIKGRQLRIFWTAPASPPARPGISRRFNRHQYVMIGIESVAAYENLMLTGIEGVDGVFMGPHD